ncbi:MAG: ceramidase domain-containing protein [Acidiferrobacterales bacterium]
MTAKTLASMSNRRREVVLLAIVSVTFMGVMLLEPIPQSLSYHDFADDRPFLGIPNFLNVISNIPFLLFGLLGVIYCLRRRQRVAPWSWLVFFIGLAAVCLGSAYYHWMPNSETLVWDRLPMTIAFMGVFIALLSEHMSPKVERIWLAPAILLGLASVIYWQYTDDLRPYIWVQLVPFLVLPFVFALFAGNYTHRRYLLYGLIAYALAKVAEFFDAEIFTLTQQLSGHSLKHLLAAVGGLYAYLMLKRRRLTETAGR